MPLPCFPCPAPWPPPPAPMQPGYGWLTPAVGCIELMQCMVQVGAPAGMPSRDAHQGAATEVPNWAGYACKDL